VKGICNIKRMKDLQRNIEHHSMDGYDWLWFWQWTREWNMRRDKVIEVVALLDVY